MDIAHTGALERIARVLAGLRLSINGDGEEGSSGPQVNQTWRRHLPDADMAAAGDAETWRRMISAALAEQSRSGPAQRSEPPEVQKRL